MFIKKGKKKIYIYIYIYVKIVYIRGDKDTIK